jgi:hypothetical protein
VHVRRPECRRQRVGAASQQPGDHACAHIPRTGDAEPRPACVVTEQPAVRRGGPRGGAADGHDGAGRLRETRGRQVGALVRLRAVGVQRDRQLLWVRGQHDLAVQMSDAVHVRGHGGQRQRVQHRRPGRSGNHLPDELGRQRRVGQSGTHQQAVRAGRELTHLGRTGRVEHTVSRAGQCRHQRLGHRHRQGHRGRPHRAHLQLAGPTA